MDHGYQVTESSFLTGSGKVLEPRISEVQHIGYTQIKLNNIYCMHKWIDSCRFFATVSLNKRNWTRFAEWQKNRFDYIGVTAAQVLLCFANSSLASFIVKPLAK